MSKLKGFRAAPLWVVAGLLGLNLILAAQPDADAGSLGGEPGACCLGIFQCIDAITETECVFAFAGIFQGEVTTCGGHTCGACCLPDESCQQFRSADVCAALGGAHEPGLECFKAACEVGACCFGDATCQELRDSDCVQAGGLWQGPDSVCGDFNQNGIDDACETSSCPHDIDNDGMVGIVDFLDLLASWGPCP